MTTNKTMDSYDEIKGMLNKVRKIQLLAKPNTYGLIKEQSSNPTALGVDTDSNVENPYIGTNTSSEDKDLSVINNVEVEIHSEDPEDLQISEEEKGKISQLIDDFRSEVSETVEFGKLNIYNDSAKLDGKINDVNLNFTFSTGNDTGLYLSNSSLLKIDDNSLGMINKLRVFESKFSGTINDLLVNRSTT